MFMWNFACWRVSGVSMKAFHNISATQQPFQTVSAHWRKSRAFSARFAVHTRNGIRTHLTGIPQAKVRFI